jgi:hypothetical protein
LFDVEPVDVDIAEEGRESEPVDCAGCDIVEVAENNRNSFWRGRERVGGRFSARTIVVLFEDATSAKDNTAISTLGMKRDDAGAFVEGKPI